MKDSGVVLIGLVMAPICSKVQRQNKADTGCPDDKRAVFDMAEK